MAGEINFTRKFMEFGNDVRDYEKSSEVGFVVTQFLWDNGVPFYPANALTHSKVSGIWLGEGERGGGDVDKLDLIFKMPDPFESDLSNPELTWFEIVLRTGTDEPMYAGFIFGTKLNVTDEIIAGHRVLTAVEPEGFISRYEFNPVSGTYEFAGSLPSAPEADTMSIRAKNRRLRRR